MLRYFTKLPNKEAAPVWKSHVNVNSYVFWENMDVYFIIICQAGPCFFVAQKVVECPLLLPPRRFNSNSKHFHHHAGVDLIIWEAGQIWLVWETIDFNSIGESDINPSNHGQFILLSPPPMHVKFNILSFLSLKMCSYNYQPWHWENMGHTLTLHFNILTVDLLHMYLKDLASVSARFRGFFNYKSMLLHFCWLFKKTWLSTQ